MINLRTHIVRKSKLLSFVYPQSRYWIRGKKAFKFVAQSAWNVYLGRDTWKIDF